MTMETVKSVETETQLNLDPIIESKIKTLLNQMTLAEKIGQLSQHNGEGFEAVAAINRRVKQGQLGSVLNQADPEIINEWQRIAVEESRLGIPLLIARDVIHGFKTVMPIPLGQAASWNPDIVERGAQIAAHESSSVGINWTFAPMVDISRDPRWGRIAESLGEDPYLCGELGAAMVRGFQGDNLSNPNSIAACVKHFCGYGASEAGRDYSSTNIPEYELHNVYLRPFKRCIDEGAASLMASFSDIDGIPATANDYLLTEILREHWKFDGLTVSDWNAVQELAVHGIAENDKDCATLAANAGIDMEMSGTSYEDYLSGLVKENLLSINQIDAMVSNVLRLKFRLGLFDNPFVDDKNAQLFGSDAALKVAQEAAQQSLVLLKNQNNLLPLSSTKKGKIAVMGPLADAPYEQLGTWIFDGDASISQSILTAMKLFQTDNLKIDFNCGLEYSRSKDTKHFNDAIKLAKNSDVAVLCLGEESILSGEAHSRACIDLPGAQIDLIKQIKATGTPIVGVILAGRSLTLTNIVDDLDAIIYAWHPGTMGGPAIAETLFGQKSPSGKLPVTLPKMVGQLPLYYSQKNTGRPPTDESVVLIDEIQQFAEQTSLGMTAFHLDAGYKPLFPFGFGLTYGEFDYSNLQLSAAQLSENSSITAKVTLANSGSHTATETVQLYIRDKVGTITRPIKELVGFQRVTLAPGEKTSVSFEITTNNLKFYTRRRQWEAEPGEFQIWIGGSSDATLSDTFSLLA
ncbi:MAG: beta-glucosidase BglX [Gammaproteobacteria bacterium]|nr:beta-glucosidase BglX [Gammaproteobacteria bacterium]